MSSVQRSPYHHTHGISIRVVNVEGISAITHHGCLGAIVVQGDKKMTAARKYAPLWKLLYRDCLVSQTSPV